MFAPNQTTYQLADRTHADRLAHSARIRAAAQERGSQGTPLNRDAHRRITARRLAATAAGALLSLAIGAGALAMQGPADEASSDDAAPTQLHLGEGGGKWLKK